MTGMAACGGDDNTIGSSSFLDGCKDGVESNATAKAYSEDICKCAQDKLKAAGLGDKTPDDADVKQPAIQAVADCTRQEVFGQ